MSETAATEPVATATETAETVTPGTDSGTAGIAAAANPPAPPAPVAPETYDLKLPASATEVGLDPAIVERTAAIARSLGLTNEAGQKLLDSVVAEAKATLEAADEAWAEAQKPGSPVWTEREEGWRTSTLKDPELGGSPEKMQASLDKANLVLSKYGSTELKAILKDSGLGSHPEFVRLMARIGKGMSESPLVMGATPNGGKPRTQAEILYGEKGYVERLPSQ